MSDPFRRHRLLEASGRFNTRGRGGRRRGPALSGEEARAQQFTRTLARALDQLQPSLDPVIRQQLLDRAAGLPPASVRGKNIDLLATALLLQNTGITPATYTTAIQDYVPAVNSDEIIMYLLFLQESQVGVVGQPLAAAPAWENTWMPADLADAAA